MLNSDSNKQTVNPAGLAGKYITLIFAILISLPALLATAQTTPLKQWDARFGGSDYDNLYSLQQTTDGGYILGGHSASGISGDKTQVSQGSNDYWIVNTDANGVKQWDKRFGGSDDDRLYSLQQTADGGYILGGYSSSGISGDKTQASQGGVDYWIVKTDANGVKQWDKRFGGSNSDNFYTLQQTTDGGYILGGHSASGISGDKTQASQGGTDYWIVKINANGVKQWDKRFGGSAFEGLNSFQQTTDGGYILGGYSFSGISGDKTQAGQGAADYWIVKTDANGVKQWDKRFGGSLYDNLYSLQQTADGGYILGGYSYSGISGDKTQASQGGYDYWIVKTDANGVKQWDKRFGGNSDDILYSLEQTADGGYTLGGSSYSGISGDKTQASQGGYDYWIVKTDAIGVKQWDAQFGGSSADNLYSLEQTADGGYILGGSSYSGISGDKAQASQGFNDYWIVKVTAEGICNTPTGLSTTNITTFSAQLNWDAALGALSYKLRYKIKNTETWTIVKPATNKWLLTGLTAGTAYVWKVKSVCGTDSILVSDFSPKEIFTTAPLKMGAAPSQENSLDIYPNPSTVEATIHFNIQQSSFVTVKIFDVNGKEMHKLVSQQLETGDHSFSINTVHFANGVYVVRMISEEGMINQKLVVQ